jgi:hypothetical protein
VSQEPVGRPDSLRIAYGALALVAILGVGLVGGWVGQTVATESRDWDTNSLTGRAPSQERACEVERLTIRTAEAAYHQQHQEFGGLYGTEAQLVAEGWLDRESPRWDIVLPSPPTDFAVYPTTGRSCE